MPLSCCLPHGSFAMRECMHSRRVTAPGAHQKHGGVLCAQAAPVGQGQQSAACVSVQRACVALQLCVQWWYSALLWAHKLLLHFCTLRRAGKVLEVLVQLAGDFLFLPKAP